MYAYIYIYVYVYIQMITTPTKTNTHKNNAGRTGTCAGSFLGASGGAAGS